VLRILDDRAAARQIGQAACQYMQSNFTISRMIDRSESSFQKVSDTPS
jgi:hypothetical protein